MIHLMVESGNYHVMLPGASDDAPAVVKFLLPTMDTTPPAQACKVSAVWPAGAAMPVAIFCCASCSCKMCRMHRHEQMYQQMQIH